MPIGPVLPSQRRRKRSAPSPPERTDTVGAFARPPGLTDHRLPRRGRVKGRQGTRLRRARTLEARRRPHAVARERAGHRRVRRAPDRVHHAGCLDCAVSPCNTRPKPEPSAAWWSPLPDPGPNQDREWAHSISDPGWRSIAAGARDAASRSASLQLPMYTPRTLPRSCPSSRAMALRAAVSIRRLTPVSVRRAGPPAAGAFQPVISSYLSRAYPWRSPCMRYRPAPRVWLS